MQLVVCCLVVVAFLLAATAALEQQQPPPPHSWNFTVFEDVYFPQWVDSFLVGNRSLGQYSFYPHPLDADMGRKTIMEHRYSRLPSVTERRGGGSLNRRRETTLYGVTDILISQRILGQLNLTETEKTAWASTILSFRRKNDSTDFFTYTELEGDICGFQPYHAAGYANAALRLIDRPAQGARWAEEIATGKKGNSSSSSTKTAADAFWNETFFPWIDPPPFPKGPKAAFWATSQAVGAVPSVLMTTEAMKKKHDTHTNSSSRTKYDEFLQWWWSWTSRLQDPSTGYWVLRPEWRPPQSKIGLGGSFHLFIIDAFRNQSWHYKQEVMNSSRSLQNATDGLWDSELGLTYGIDMDGLFSLLRSASHLGLDEMMQGEVVCKKYLATAHRILTDPIEVLAYRVYSHLLPGALVAIAECQKWFPNLVVTRRPWTQTLDIAPYI